MVNRKCIAVLGMHRGGTSAVMGALHLAGVPLGENYLNPSPNNPKGYFENMSLMLVNERILRFLKSAWDDPFLLPAGWWEDGGLLTFGDEIRAIVESELGDAELFGIKDPRLCILLPFWQRVLASMGVSTHYVMALRNPLETAHSSLRRTGFSLEKSLVLWMNHTLSAELHTREMPRVFVTFDDLITRPGRTLETIQGVLGLRLPRPYEEIQAQLGEFLEPTLKHHNRGDGRAGEQWPPFVFELYALLCAMADSAEETAADRDRIDSIRREYLALHTLFYSTEIVSAAREPG